MRNTGMLLGKFMPPHLGHKYLVDFALERVDELTVLVCSLPTEPIPGALRYEWMREMFPTARVLHVDEVVPQEPSEHRDFWSIWHDLIRGRISVGPDYVFASEEYGYPLAKILGATFVPVDVERRAVPISATMIREDWRRHADFLPEVVRRWFENGGDGGVSG